MIKIIYNKLIMNTNIDILWPNWAFRLRILIRDDRMINKKPNKVWSWRAETKTKTFVEFEKLKWKCMSTQKTTDMANSYRDIYSTSSGIDPNTFVGSRFLFLAVDNFKFLQCNDKKGLVQIIAWIFALCCFLKKKI